MPFASVGKYKIFYVDEGEGFPIVLIHGLAGDHQAWAPQIAALRGRHRVIAFDNRGAGKSTQVDEPVTTEDLARDTLGLMDALGVSRAHIVGRSMGGSIAQHIALRAPDRVQSLVLCASFAKLDPLGMRVLTNMREVLEWRGSWEEGPLRRTPHAAKGGAATMRCLLFTSYSGRDQARGLRAGLRSLHVHRRKWPEVHGDRRPRIRPSGRLRENASTRSRPDPLAVDYWFRSRNGAIAATNSSGCCRGGQ
jgi:pimeloyl-ACP methyl ester carboxylesterase